MSNQIEHECHCGEYAWKKGYADPGRWVCQRTVPGTPLQIEPGGYCPVCGDYLGNKGIARRTVVLPEEPIEVWIATASLSYSTMFIVEPTREIDSDGLITWTVPAKGFRHLPPCTTPAGQKRKYHLIPVEEDDDGESD